MSEPLQVTIPDLTPRYFRILLPLWLFAAFLTGVKFLPGIRNNFGPFEIIGLLIIAAFFMVEPRTRVEYRHPVILTVATILIFAVLSQIKIPASRMLFGAVQVAILVFLLLFLVVIRQFVERYRISPQTLLGIITISVLIVGPWVYLDGMYSGDDVQAAGPFRNRAHMANYMLTAFWLVAMHVQWPGLPKRSRYTAYLAAGLALWAIAVSGRRSVYLALFLGLALWIFAFLLASRERLRILVSALFVVSLLLGLYRFGHVLGERGVFFQKRVAMIDDRLRDVVTPGTGGIDTSFYQLQREGVARAVRDSPILGIGWGGFPKSDYSPTGHEVHSTPLRFLAELGLIGLALYLTLLGYLLLASIRLFLRMRRTPYSLTYLILAIATWSMTVSHFYNRHITERTFWIYLAVFLALELFARDWHYLKRTVEEWRLEHQGQVGMGVGSEDSLRPAGASRLVYLPPS